MAEEKSHCVLLHFLIKPDGCFRVCNDGHFLKEHSVLTEDDVCNAFTCKKTSLYVQLFPPSLLDLFSKLDSALFQLWRQISIISRGSGVIYSPECIWRQMQLTLRRLHFRDRYVDSRKYVEVTVHSIQCQIYKRIYRSKIFFPDIYLPSFIKAESKIYFILCRGKLRIHCR